MGKVGSDPESGTVWTMPDPDRKKIKTNQEHCEGIVEDSQNLA